MSEQELKPITIPGIQEIDDRAAENTSGGAFFTHVRYFNNPQVDRVTHGDNSSFNIDDAFSLRMFNVDLNSDDPNAMGNTFGIEYRNNQGQVVMRENIQGVNVIGAQRLMTARTRGATTAHINQYFEFCDC